MSSIRVLSPAKINLVLRVLGKRDDGYHDLYTLMEPVALFDEIFLEESPGSGITIECPGSNLPEDRSNLAYRAAALFLERTRLQRHITIKINKKIPIGAGLGGGSSNAATVLMTLNSALGTGLPDSELRGMGAALGSDVPFFIMKTPAVATGRGEVLRRVTLPSLYFVLINPGFSVSTKWVYDNFVLTNPPEDNMLLNSDRLFKTLKGLLDNLANDLEAVTCARYPEVTRLKGLLLQSGALAALMSGSGPTVFGLFDDKAAAKRAFKLLEDSLAISGESLFLARGL